MSRGKQGAIAFVTLIPGLTMELSDPDGHFTLGLSRCFR
jgi:hypothetical protein